MYKKKKKKKIRTAFKFLGFEIKFSSNIKEANFLDVTLNLSDNSDRPFFKTDSFPFDINVNSNQPNSIIKHVPKAVNMSLRSLSLNKKCPVKVVKCYLSP